VSKRMGALLTLAVLALSAFMVYSGTYVNIVRTGPYTTPSTAFDSTTAGGQPGGTVRIYKDSTDTMLVGDVVYLARSRVHKSTTIAGYNTVAGVVVGGSATSMRGNITKAGWHDTASFAYGRVYVLTCGRAYVSADSVGLAPGTQLIPSTSVAGAVKARTTVIDTNYRVMGFTLDSAVAGAAVMARICVK